MEVDARKGLYLTDGSDILSATTMTGRAEQIRLQGVTWYRRNESGQIVRQVRADSAEYAAPGWRLIGATSFDVGTAETQTDAEVTVAPGITPSQIELESVDADALGFMELRDSIQAYRASGRATAELEAKWWHKLSGPLSAFLMPLLGAVAAFGLARSGQLFVRAVIGMALGFAYFVVDNAALAMGSFGGYPPLLAAWAPFFLFLLLGETVLVRTEE